MADVPQDPLHHPAMLSVSGAPPAGAGPAAGAASHPVTHLDDTVPPGSTAIERCVLMQQARIDALESDMAQLHRERQRHAEARTAAAAAAAMAAARARLPPAVAIHMPIFPPPQPQAPPPAPLCSQLVAQSLWLFLLALVVASACAGWICTVLGAGDIHHCNTPVSALVTGTYASWAPACASNITYVSHDGASQAVTVLLVAAAAAQGGGCPLAGSTVPMCYSWQHPAVGCCVGGCGSTMPYHKARAMLTAGLVMLSLGSAALVALWARHVFTGSYLLRWP